VIVGDAAMKVPESKEIHAVQSVEPPARAQPRSQADRVSVTSSADLASSITSAQATAPASRAARLAEVRAAVRSGSYRPDPEQIAQQIVDEAEVDAQVLAALAR
jgi:negative regulator of flagellin synthesis FlgM